jgi:hypothetical protein
MSKETERVYLEGRMAAQWKIISPTVKIGFENTNFKPPTANEVYAEFFIVGGRGIVAGGVGDGKVLKRTPGFIQITIWAPDESGTKTASILRDKAGKIFELHRGRTSDNDVITFGIADHPNAPKVNGWYPCIVKVPFHRDEVVPITPGNV